MTDLHYSFWHSIAEAPLPDAPLKHVTAKQVYELEQALLENQPPPDIVVVNGLIAELYRHRRTVQRLRWHMAKLRFALVVVVPVLLGFVVLTLWSN